MLKFSAKRSTAKEFAVDLTLVAGNCEIVFIYLEKKKVDCISPTGGSNKPQLVLVVREILGS